MENIISFFPEEELKEATAVFDSGKNVSFSGSGNSSSKSMLMSSALNNKKRGIGRVLWVCNDHNEQNVISKAMKMWSDRPVFTYKRRNEDERLSFSTTSDFERSKNISLIEFVSRVYEHKDGVFILNFESILQNFPQTSDVLAKRVFLKKGEKIDLVEFIQRIVSMGYESTDSDVLNKGEYFKKGDSLYIYPVNFNGVYRIDINFDNIDGVYSLDKTDYQTVVGRIDCLELFSLEYDKETEDLIDLFSGEDVVVDDEIDVVDEYYDVWNNFMEKAANEIHTVSFSSFNDDVSNHKHLHYLSVLRFRSAYDLANDLRDKISGKWKVLFFTKNMDYVRGLLRDQAIPFVDGMNNDDFNSSSVFLIDVQKEDSFPQSFQAPKQKLILINDTDISSIKEEKRKNVEKNIFNDFLTSLKTGDFVVHADHGIAKFLGLDQKTVDMVTKEYLKLGYAENDKLFVPIDQADKVNKYIGSTELMPKLTRLGSAEWNTVTSKVKKETQKIAKELLKLYAERKASCGIKYKAVDGEKQVRFDEGFPYEETPGQIKAIEDVRRDMDSSEPMDRLVCGDVGFGKTEVAMRATFKAVMGGRQVAVIAPITILADQHYKSFVKRMEGFDVRIAVLSRFKSPSENKKTIDKIAKGDVDIVIGTHRLLQPDVKFKDLGLVIVDEEQRFGVKQKEKLKEMRKEVDILTLTATPIPRTLNICLNKLRDITTITTPPYGRLPIITEVRKYSPSLVREAVLKEIERGGQVYFLHNRVQTIDGFAEKLQQLIPEARFCVAHGKLGSGDLEDRIMAFKDGKYDVLVSSTIIENGIDLANANTLIVNNAERFGLSQLYQLRGRVGRGKSQAYAYFLYHGQRLKLDAKKRLRAIVEASELGSGFQIAMKDLEIRGAGDILGANQHGVINVVGVSHFMRMLNKAVEDLKEGRVYSGEEDIEDVSIELPVPSYIPDSYIPDSRDKITAYQRLSSSHTIDELEEVREELVEDFGKLPMEVNNLFKIIEIKILAKKAGLLNVKAESVPMSKDKEIVLHVSKKVKPANIISLLEKNSKWVISGSRLRINIKDLGDQWFGGLKDSIVALSEAKQHGK